MQLRCLGMRMMYYSYVSEERVAFVLKDYVDVHFQEDITRDTLSDLSYYNPDYAARLFKKETGYSISEYINNIRISRAQNFLVESDLDIAEIARMCGFEDQSYFTKVFRRISGVTPKKYRDSRGGAKKEIVIR